MIEITQCGGFDCPMKEACGRYNNQPKEIMQTYFLDPPYHINEGGFSCDMYWGQNSEAIWQDLQEAVGIRIPNLNDAVDNTNKHFGSDE